MNEQSAHSSTSLLHWLAAYTGFPQSRLPDKAELLLLTASAATEEAVSLKSEKHIPGNDNALMSSQRALAMRRSRVHFKSDNSAKV